MFMCVVDREVLTSNEENAVWSQRCVLEMGRAMGRGEVGGRFNVLAA
jgi:hypothetical protein